MVGQLAVCPGHGGHARAVEPALAAAVREPQPSDHDTVPVQLAGGVIMIRDLGILGRRRWFGSLERQDRRGGAGVEGEALSAARLAYEVI